MLVCSLLGGYLGFGTLKSEVTEFNEPCDICRGGRGMADRLGVESRLSTVDIRVEDVATLGLSVKVSDWSQ